MMLSPLLIPDTLSYMIAGYLILAGAVLLYLASLIIRWRKAAREYQRYQKDLGGK